MPESKDPLAEALAVLDRHLLALNAQDAAALAATLHFPHFRLAGGRMQRWDTPATYLDDFRARAGDGWSYTEWNSREPIAVTEDKVHLDVTFTRYRADGSALGRFRSLWVISRLDGVWAAQLRSSFAA